MAIVRSYNKHTGVCYAYDVQYVWSDKAQKKVPVRKCIGKFDPLTNEIIPNGKRGPKPGVMQSHNLNETSAKNAMI